MLHQLAKLHGVQWQKRDYAEFAGALGAGTLIRTASTFGIRQLVKLIPVYGQTAGAAAAAAASFAATYALGKAANFYLARRRQGVTTAEVSRVYREALRDAFRQGQGARHRRRRDGSQGVVSKPARNPSASRAAVLLAVALMLPAASLIPLGSLWLWQHGLHPLLGAFQLRRRDPASTTWSAACSHRRRRFARPGRATPRRPTRAGLRARMRRGPTSRRSPPTSMPTACRAATPSSISGWKPSR